MHRQKRQIRYDKRELEEKTQGRVPYTSYNFV